MTAAHHKIILARFVRFASLLTLTILLALPDAYAAVRYSKATVNKKSNKFVAKSTSLSVSRSFGEITGLRNTPDPLDLSSSVALVQDQSTDDVLFAKNTHAVLPIASITKLMTAVVVLDAKQSLDEWLTVTEEDIDHEKFTRSRLVMGTALSRADMLHLALMASENRAAHALGRHYPGGLAAFVRAMNDKARDLNMRSSRFVDPTGLNSQNVSSAADLARLVTYAYQHQLIRQYSTATEYWVSIAGQPQQFRNTNALVAEPDWQIGVSKTGFINEAGKCLVMQTVIEGRPFVIVLLDSIGKHARAGDANRIKRWLVEALARPLSSGEITPTQAYITPPGQLRQMH